jgi:hypothetical protein
MPEMQYTMFMRTFLQNVVNVDEAYKAKITMIHKSTKQSWISIQDYFIRKQANKPFHSLCNGRLGWIKIGGGDTSKCDWDEFPAGTACRLVTESRSRVATWMFFAADIAFIFFCLYWCLIGAVHKQARAVCSRVHQDGTKSLDFCLTSVNCDASNTTPCVEP